MRDNNLLSCCPGRAEQRYSADRAGSGLRLTSVFEIPALPEEQVVAVERREGLSGAPARCSAMLTLTLGRRFLKLARSPGTADDPTKRPSTGGGSDARMACVRTSGAVRWTTALASDADGRSFHLCAVMNSELPEVDSAHLQRFAMRL